MLLPFLPKTLGSLFFLFFAVQMFAQDPSAIADFESSDKGVLLPRMTSDQRTTIIEPATGLLVYQVDSLEGVYCNIGTPQNPDWINMTSLARILVDTDGDTRVDVEKSQDDDELNIMLEGNEIVTLSSNTDGIPTLEIFDSLDNLFIGQNAGRTTSPSNGTNARNNTFIGQNAGLANTTGYNNTALGKEALLSNINGNWNTAAGAESLKFNNANNNTAYGFHTLRANVSGIGNTAVGRSSLTENIDGSFNTAVGERSLNKISTIDSDNNSTLGYYALNLAAQAQRNVAIGSFAGANDTVSIQNVFIGFGAGGGITPIPTERTAKQRNVFVGYEAGANNKGSDNVFIGYQAGKDDTTTFGKLYIENSDATIPLVWGDFVHRRIGIDRKAETYTLEVNGNASKTSGDGDWVINSDSRLKKNITPLEGSKVLDKLLKLRGVNFEWNDPIKTNKRPKGVRYGLIAQDIQKAFPELVITDSNGYLQTTYSTYDAMYIEVIRLLHSRIEVLEAESIQKTTRIESLETSYGELEQRIKALEGSIGGNSGDFD
jgi:hypothetical protein